MYNILDKEIASLVNGNETAGNRSVAWNANGQPSGIYLYRLSVRASNGEVFSETKRMLYLK